MRKRESIGLVALLLFLLGTALWSERSRQVRDRFLTEQLPESVVQALNGPLTERRLESLPLVLQWISEGVGGSERRGPRLNAWILDPYNHAILAATRDPDWKWEELPELAPFSFTLPGGRKLRYLKIDEAQDQYLLWEVAHGRGAVFSAILSFLDKAWLAVVFCALVGFSVSAAYVKAHVREMRRIFLALKDGDLKARLKTGSGLSRQFNAMASEIEQLVEKLKQTEGWRSQLLKELAHDIRTPLTSLRYLMESLGADAKPSREELKSKVRLALSEVEYFQKLIEDLFLLAQVSGRGSLQETSPLDLVAIVDETLGRVANTRSQGKGKIRTKLDAPPRWAPQVAFDPYLLRRMLRNALENAAEHARSRVEVSLRSPKPNRIEILVRDDGKGFNPDALQHYGSKRPTRFMDREAGDRLSLGLGSVIIKAIVNAYQGELAARNWFKGEGKIGGAELRLTLPLAHAEGSLEKQAA